jgi:hypothetical protein
MREDSCETSQINKLIPKTVFRILPEKSVDIQSIFYLAQILQQTNTPVVMRSFVAKATMHQQMSSLTIICTRLSVGSE